MIILITKHAYKRGRERLNVNRKALARMAVKIYFLGKRPHQTDGMLRKFLEDKSKRKNKEYALRLHGKFIFVFKGAALITVAPLPKLFRRMLKCA